MTLGWRVSVYRQVDDRCAPSADHDPTGVRVAIRRAQVPGLAWLKDLAESNDAVHLADNSGYPSSGRVRPARTTGLLSFPGDLVDLGRLPGGVMIDRAATEDCQPDE